MTTSSDRELIVRYVRQHDHEAFAELVRRYIALVHSAALRQIREPGLADDVTQAAMIVLARRAREISCDVVLASWLFTVTHHIAQNALKSQARRTAHEQIAATQRVDSRKYDAELRDVLDAAIAKLPDIERGGVVLHYFNNCTHEEIAGALGMSSEAVRKRVSRAVAKLRDFVAGRGFDISMPALAATLQAEASSSARTHKGTYSVVSIALLAATSGAAPTSAPAILANGILASARTALKWKIAATIALTAAGFAGIAAIPLTPPAVQAISTPASPTTVPIAAPAAQSGVVAQVMPKIRIEALASAPHPAEPTQWFSIDGKSIDMPDEALVDNQVDTDSQPDRQIVFKIDIPKNLQYNIYIPNARTWSTTGVPLQGDTSLYRCRFAFDGPPPETLTILFNIATNDWQTIATIDELKEDTEVDAGPFGALTFSPPAESQRWGTHVNVRHPGLEVMPQMFAIDKDGKEHVQKSINNDRAGPGEAQAMFIFDIPADQIRGVRLQIREFDKQVEFTNIALQPDQHTEPKVVVKDLKAKK